MANFASNLNPLWDLNVMHGTDCDQEKTLSIRTGRLTMEIAHDFIAPSWPVVAAAGVMFSCGWKALGEINEI